MKLNSTQQSLKHITTQLHNNFKIIVKVSLTTNKHDFKSMYVREQLCGRDTIAIEK